MTPKWRTSPSKRRWKSFRITIAIIHNPTSFKSVNLFFKKNVNFKFSFKFFNRLKFELTDDLDEYEPNLVYLPSALVVHRCGKSVGCCQQPGTVCQSVENEEEDVQFSVRTQMVGKKKFVTNKFLLRNHTRCHCVHQLESRATRSISIWI